MGSFYNTMSFSDRVLFIIQEIMIIQYQSEYESDGSSIGNICIPSGTILSL